jgi:hypothetical protein
VRLGRSGHQAVDDAAIGIRTHMGFIPKYQSLPFFARPGPPSECQ